MEQYKRDFIDFMVSSSALKFGEFTLKSGRHSPFFFNAGSFVSGDQIERVGEFYAKAIREHFGDCDVLFGPAYKGIPLAVAGAIAYSKLFGHDVRYSSNRKEIKDHGDKGILLGHQIKSGERIVIVEDVATSGKSIEETYPILKAQGDVEIIGEIVSLDRQEKASADSGKSALQAISSRFGFPTCAIVSMSDVVEALDGTLIDPVTKKRIEDYYETWGAR